jgi:hypothetical protein
MFDLTTMLNFYNSMKASCSVDIATYFDHFPVYAHIPNADIFKNFESFPLVEHLIDGVVIAFFLTLFRVLLDKALIRPVGKWCMKQTTEESLKELYNRNPKQCKVLVQEFDKINEETKKANKKKAGEGNKNEKDNALSINNDSSRMRNLSNLHSIPYEQVKEFFTLRSQLTKDEKQLHKFSEVSFKVLCHTFLTVYGIYHICFGTTWLSNPLSVWENYPLQQISSPIYWYVMAEFGLYIHEFIFFFLEAHRSDDIMMLVHHIATLILISCSYTLNMNGVGTLTMLVHDCADSLLEFAKLFNYMKDARPWAEGVSDGFFIGFALTFITSRCGVFPYKVIFQACLQARNNILPKFFAFDILVGFLCVLQVLHILWSVMIVKMAIGFLKGEELKDERSFVEGLEKTMSSLTAEEQENELIEKKQALAKLDALKEERKEGEGYSSKKIN